MRFLFALLMMTGAAMAQPEPRPFVFTPSHNNTVQPIFSGVPVQVQLPVGPAEWRVERLDRNAKLAGNHLMASPGRIPGSIAVQIFDFTLRKTQPTVIVIRPVFKRGHHHRRGRDTLRGRPFAETFTLTLKPEIAGTSHD